MFTLTCSFITWSLVPDCIFSEYFSDKISLWVQVYSSVLHRGYSTGADIDLKLLYQRFPEFNISLVWKQSFQLKSPKLCLGFFSLFLKLKCLEFSSYWFTLDLERSVFTHHTSLVKICSFHYHSLPCTLNSLLSPMHWGSFDFNKLLLQQKLPIKSQS